MTASTVAAELAAKRNQLNAELRADRLDRALVARLHGEVAALEHLVAEAVADRLSSFDDLPTMGGCDAYDWENTFTGCDGGIDWREVPVGGGPTTASDRRVVLADVAEVVAFHATTNADEGDDRGTELSLHAVFRLTDGSWAAVASWNDYTGWGCQDGVSWLLAADQATLYRFGLDDGDRRALDIDLDGAP